MLESDRKTRLWVIGSSQSSLADLGCGLRSTSESAARGQGTVQVDGNRKPIQHYEGGIVSEIFVASGDYVAVGQPLIQLAPLKLSRAAHHRGRVSKAALVARLTSERDGFSEVVF